MTAQPADDSSVDPSAEDHDGSQTNRKVRLAGIAALAQAQERVVSRRQLRALGWSDGQIDHEIRYGRWHAPAWGVVALQNAPLTYDQRLWLGVLHAGDGAVLTHLTSCRRAGLDWKGDEETIHVYAQGRSGRPDRRLLLPPDQTALRPVGAPGAFRTAAAADRARRPADRRA